MRISKLTCPYCYRDFRPWRIEFRCTGRRGPTGLVCAPVLDELLQRYTGNATPQPPTFRRRWRDTVKGGHRAVHPECLNETSYRICPVCHASLPVRFGRVDHRLIALIGAREAGKTVYLTVLLHEMRNRIGRAFDAAVSGADDSTRTRFRQEYESLLYDDHHLPIRTPSATKSFDHVPPMVFEFAVRGRGRFGTRAVLNLLSFFDSAGEDLVSQESVDHHARYLRAADGVIVLLDPMQMPQVRTLLLPDTKPPLAADQEHVLERVTGLLHAANRNPARPIRKPIAVALSKIDVIEHALDATSPLRRDSDYQPGTGRAFDTDDGDEVHVEVQQLLNSWDSGQIDRYLARNYRRYRYFGLTALGEPPQESPQGKLVSERQVRPRRTADPLLWLLSEFGAIAATKPSAQG